MPEFETYVDVNVNEYLDSCSTSEKIEALEYLLEDTSSNTRLEEVLKDHLKGNSVGSLGTPAMGEKNMSYDQEEFIKSLGKLNSAYYQLSSEDIEIVNKMAKRF